MYINSPSPVLFWSFYENSKSVATNSKLHTHSQFGKRNRLNLALSVYFTKVSNQRNGIITNPNLVLLRIPFFRILHRGVLGVLLDLLASGETSVDEGEDEEAKILWSGKRQKMGKLIGGNSIYSKNSKFPSTIRKCQVKKFKRGIVLSKQKLHHWVIRWVGVNAPVMHHW